MDKNNIYSIAQKALSAYDAKNYDELANACSIVYNYYARNQNEFLTEKHPYLIGLVFYYGTHFRERDRDIAETKVENTLYLLGRTILESMDDSERISSASRCFMMLMSQRQYARNIFSKLHEYDVDSAITYVMSYFMSFCLRKDIHVFINTNEHKFFNDCLEVYSKYRFNNDPTEEGHKIFLMIMDIIENEINF